MKGGCEHKRVEGPDYALGGATGDTETLWFTCMNCLTMFGVPVVMRIDGEDVERFCESNEKGIAK